MRTRFGTCVLCNPQPLKTVKTLDDVHTYVCAYIHTYVRMYNGLCCHGKGTTLAYAVVLLRDGEGNAVHNTIFPQQWADTIQGPLHNNISVVCKLNTSNTENLQEVSFCDYYVR